MLLQVCNKPILPACVHGPAYPHTLTVHNSRKFSSAGGGGISRAINKLLTQEWQRQCSQNPPIPLQFIGNYKQQPLLFISTLYDVRCSIICSWDSWIQMPMRHCAAITMFKYSVKNYYCPWYCATVTSMDSFSSLPHDAMHTYFEKHMLFYWLHRQHGELSLA